MNNVAREVYLGVTIESVIENETKWTENESNSIKRILYGIHFRRNSVDIFQIFESRNSVVITNRFLFYITFCRKRKEYERDRETCENNASDDNTSSVSLESLLGSTREWYRKGINIRVDPE